MTLDIVLPGVAMSTCSIAGQEVYLFGLCLRPPLPHHSRPLASALCSSFSDFPLAQRLLPAGLGIPTPALGVPSHLGLFPLVGQRSIDQPSSYICTVTARPPHTHTHTELPSVLATTGLGLPCQPFWDSVPVWSLLCPPPLSLVSCDLSSGLGFKEGCMEEVATFIVWCESDGVLVEKDAFLWV